MKIEELPLIATVAEVATWLGWTEAKLRNRIQKGSGHPPYVKLQRRIEFRRDDVLEWYRKLVTVKPADPLKGPGKLRGWMGWPISPDGRRESGR